MTIEEAYRRGLVTREQWIRSKDRASLQQTFDSLGLDPKTPVSRLTRDFVRDLRSRWMQEPGKRAGTTLSASTINHRLSMLSVLLQVADLPPHGVKHLSVKGNRRTRRISADEVGRIIGWCEAHQHRRGALSLRDAVLLALETGARQGELLSLSWSDVRADTVTFRDTKNHETRTIPLTAAASRLLEARRGLPAPFSDLTANRIKDLWQDMRFDLGLATDEEFVFHTLRHEALSRLADRGVNAFTIAAIAGHASIATTQIYVKASMSAMRDALATGTDVLAG